MLDPFIGEFRPGPINQSEELPRPSPAGCVVSIRPKCGSLFAFPLAVEGITTSPGWARANSPRPKQSPPSPRQGDRENGNHSPAPLSLRSYRIVTCQKPSRRARTRMQWNHQNEAAGAHGPLTTSRRWRQKSHCLAVRRYSRACAPKLDASSRACNDATLLYPTTCSHSVSRIAGGSELDDGRSACGWLVCSHPQGDGRRRMLRASREGRLDLQAGDLARVLTRSDLDAGTTLGLSASLPFRPAEPRRWWCSSM